MQNFYMEKRILPYKKYQKLINKYKNLGISAAALVEINPYRSLGLITVRFLTKETLFDCCSVSLSV